MLATKFRFEQNCRPINPLRDIKPSKSERIDLTSPTLIEYSCRASTQPNGDLIDSLANTGMTYAAAGVDIDAGNSLVDRIKPICKATQRAGCVSNIGGFGGVFDPVAAGYTDPLLVSGTDGVGTKLDVAKQINTHSTIGIDLVAM